MNNEFTRCPRSLRNRGYVFIVCAKADKKMRHKYGLFCNRIGDIFKVDSAPRPAIPSRKQIVYEKTRSVILRMKYKVN